MVHAQESKNAQKIKQKNNFSISIKKNQIMNCFLRMSGKATWNLSTRPAYLKRNSRILNFFNSGP